MRRIVMLFLLSPAVAAAGEQDVGQRVYLEHCAQCHEGGVAKAPHKMFLEMMAPDAIHA